MPVDPELEPFLALINAAEAPEMTADSAPDLRPGFVALAQMLGQGAQDVAVEALTIPRPAGDIAARVYRPAGVERPAVLVWFHGGGFVVGDLDSADAECRNLSSGSGAAIVSVDYRRAPEDPFPAATDDALAAVRWVAGQGPDLHLDVSRLAVGGDSAGGNLAAVTALRIRDEGGPHLRFQLLVYPVIDLAGVFDPAAWPSLVDNGEGFFLTTAMMRFFSASYVPNASDRSDPRASPLTADRLEDLPPALVMTCGLDPLRDEGEAYAKALAGDGVEVELHREEGGIHYLLALAEGTAIGRRFLDVATTGLRRALA